MANLLYLVHRMPYPPNKGDKVRSFHLLQHLTTKHRVFVGTFIDDEADAVHVDALRAMCAGLHVSELHPTRARLTSLMALVTGEALTLLYYRNAGLRRWVAGILARERIDAVVVFSSSMAQYAEDVKGLPVLVDFVDVDSAKWTAYADQHRWPMSWLYRREGARLLAYERAVAKTSRRSFFCTDKETRLFLDMAPECAGGVEPMSNGVDAQYFSPASGRASPFAPGEWAIVFTGAMDYWPNVDAVTWFAQEVMPTLRRSRPNLRFHIVGRAPSAAVRALASASVVVTGTVPDVRPYLQHAGVVVAPLRLARGIQNKILEAMAMARPVVAAAPCVDAIDAQPGTEIRSASDPADYVRCVEELLADPALADAVGQAGRRRVLKNYSWSAHMSALDRHLAPACNLAVA
ncbi:MAG: sugar transferase [Leptothrix sp. (in: Bacteria)]|nr:sugar transferase [Leptothrix sp. (in: b-proteobacteria)]